MGARLLILSPTSGHGGSEEYLLEVARHATEHGWEVKVAFELSDRTRSLAAELRATSRVVSVNVPVRGWRRWGVVGQILATTAALLRVRPDVAMVVLPWPNLGMGCMLAPALAAIPTAVVFQLAPWPARTGRWAGWCRWAQHRRQRWIAVSDQNSGAVVQTFGVPRDSVATIYNGGPDPVSLSSDAVSAARQSLRAELQLPPTARIVVTVGRLGAQKGYGDLLQSLPGIVADNRDVFFVWVGEGELRAELESSIEQSGLQPYVRLMGERSDVDRILDGADLFLLPSHFEGLPFALLEALAQGTPTISSDAGGSAEVVRHGVDGLIHRRRDPADLAEKLNWALAHPGDMRAMAESGRSRAASFSKARMLEQILAVLDQLRDGRSPRLSASHHPPG